MFAVNSVVQLADLFIQRGNGGNGGPGGTGGRGQEGGFGGSGGGPGGGVDRPGGTGGNGGRGGHGGGGGGGAGGPSIAVYCANSQITSNGNVTASGGSPGAGGMGGLAATTGQPPAGNPGQDGMPGVLASLVGCTNTSVVGIAACDASPCIGPPPQPCDADIAPPGGDGVVNVNDLLKVISEWGTCP